MTRQDAVNWLLSETGGRLDFDGQFGNQCFDYFNFYYQFLTGRNPYWDGYAVPGAKDIWNVGNDRFTKIANDPNDANQIPQPGDILIYNGNWGGGFGHVEMVLSADVNGATVSAQNTKGQYVSQDYRSWSRIQNALIGWLSFNGFSVPAPVVVEITPPATPELPKPVPVPVEIVPPVVVPKPTEDPAPTPFIPETPPVAVVEAPQEPIVVQPKLSTIQVIIKWLGDLLNIIWKGYRK